VKSPLYFNIHIKVGGRMSLNSKDLMTISEMPLESNITLKTIADFYESQLCGNRYVYEVKHKNTPLILHFKTGNLPHLLGIHKIKIKNFNRGELMFGGLKEGEITFEILKGANKGVYSEILYRILYFPFVYQLLQRPKIVLFNQSNPNSIIDAEIMFYDKYHKRYIHLGLRQEKSTSEYVAVTFLESKTSKHNNRKHIPFVDRNVSEISLY
jgi:hypothetical protein